MPENKWKEGEKERLRERLGGEAHTSASNIDYEFLELELLEQRRSAFNFSTDIA